MDAIGFFIKLEFTYLRNWVFENNDAGRVFRGAIKLITCDRTRVYIDCFFVNTTDEQGNLIEWPIRYFYYDLADIVEYDIKGEVYSFRHKEYGLFQIQPD